MDELEEIVQLLYQAAQEKRACRIQLAGEPLPRIIHPYGIYRTTRNKIMLAAWQERGFTKAGGWILQKHWITTSRHAQTLTRTTAFMPNGYFTYKRLLPANQHGVTRQPTVLIIRFTPHHAGFFGNPLNR